MHIPARWGVLCLALILTLAVGACSRTAASTPAKPHVFVIVMENKSPDAAMQGVFTSSLASKYRVAANYSAVSHPSLPNYLALSSGQTYGIRDDNFHVLPAGGIGAQLTAAGITWRAYMEGMTAGCLENTYPYDVHHNPFAYYGGRCPSNVVPLSSMAADLKGNGPMFSWISPDMCHDQHDCSLAVGDDWLRQTVGLITQSKAWTANGILFVVWDEDDGSTSNRVLSLVLSPNRSHKVSNQPYTHYSLLATVEDMLGVGRLGQAAGAKTMTDLTAP